MDVIDEGKSNRHVAVTSEFLIPCSDTFIAAEDTHWVLSQLDPSCIRTWSLSALSGAAVALAAR